VQAHFNAGTGYRSAVLADAPLAYYRLDEDSRPATETTVYTVWCSVNAILCASVQTQDAKPHRTTTTATCGTGGCGISLANQIGGSGSGKKTAGLTILGTGGGDLCATTNDCQKLADALARLAQRLAGFSDDGEPLIVDNSIAVNSQAVADLLRAQGYNAQTVSEIFGEDPEDPAIRALADVVNGRVLASDVDHDIEGGFGDRIIQVAGVVRKAETILRIVVASS